MITDTRRYLHPPDTRSCYVAAQPQHAGLGRPRVLRGVSGCAPRRYDWITLDAIVPRRAILGGMNRTHTTKAVIADLLSDPDSEFWAYDVAARINKSGTAIERSTANSILRRMSQSGMLSGRWEDPNVVVGRPVRRIYKLTDKGKTELPLMLGPRTPAKVAANQ